MPATAPDLVPASTPTLTDHARITNHWLPLSIHREAVLVGDSSSDAQGDDGAVFQLGRDARRADGADHRGASSLAPGPIERALRHDARGVGLLEAQTAGGALDLANPR